MQLAIHVIHRARNVADCTHPERTIGSVPVGVEQVRLSGACAADDLGAFSTKFGAPLPHLGFPVAQLAALLGDLRLGDRSVAVTLRLPSSARLDDVVRVQAATHLICDLVELGIDPVPFAMGVGSDLLFGWQRRFIATVALAHSGSPYVLVVGPPTATLHQAP